MKNQSRQIAVPRRKVKTTRRPKISTENLSVFKVEQAVRQVTGGRKNTLCLLISAHNEEQVLEYTLRSAIAAGMKPSDIYVVDDFSNDKTSAVAKSVLGRENVMRVKRSGKGLALTKAARKFDLVERYKWIHLADGDGSFSSNYFKVFRKNLRVSNAAATGYIRSLKGSIVGQFRVVEYAIGMDIVRRFQDLAGIISIIPGPTSCFRSDVFRQVAFNTGALAEDFDVTLQIHRKNLGTIQFIEEAVAYTQDPLTFRDFVKQIHRWNKGVLQGLFTHKIGTKISKLDAYLSYQVGLNLAMFTSYVVVMPIIAAERGFAEIIAATFMIDVIVAAVVAAFAAMRSNRWDIFNAFPHLYIYRWVSLLVFIWCFVEVVILGRDRSKHGKKVLAWEGVKRRAQIGQ
ncbi:MAG TPA: glycosyltransferase family 2 protein [Candidatus Saccharimonadales bacterium]|nr:glycosyltransferase family 2 protein [Candidatus Saccharimonadales bacterium]